MADVFISYKREDRAFVERLSAALTDLDLDVWFDQALVSGDKWGERIMEEVAAAAAVMVCWSPQACLSQWVLREAAAGAARGVLMPLMIHACDLPKAFAELHATDLSGWDGQIGDPRFLGLMSKLQQLTGRTNLARNARLVAGGQQEELVALLRGLLVGKARSREAPFTYAEVEAAIRETAKRQRLELGEFAQPSLWGALDEIADQNRRAREPPLGVLVVDKDYGLPGRGYFQKHVGLAGVHDTLEQRVFEAQLERVRSFDWSRDP